MLTSCLLMAAAVGHTDAGHVCQHGAMQQSAPAVYIPAPTGDEMTAQTQPGWLHNSPERTSVVSGTAGVDGGASALSSSSHHRLYAQQSAWHPIRVTFNFTLAENPGLDLSVTQRRPQACTAVNQIYTVREVDVVNPANCSDGTKIQFIDNCQMRCRDVDMMNAQLVNSLKAAATKVATHLQNALSVLDGVTNNTITVTSNVNFNCGMVSLPQVTLPTDLLVMVTVRPLEHLSGTLAFASSCLRHPTTDRPILAHMNVAPDTIAKNAALDTVLLHELTHALGFSPSMFPFYRHPSDPTKTYMEYDPIRYPTGPVLGDGIVLRASTTLTTTTITATAGVAPPPPRTVNIEPPFSIKYEQLGPGKKLKFIGPTTIDVARTYFQCTTLDGVELENGGSSVAATATHWEKRILYYELMSSTQNLRVGSMSVFTLALLSDTGWYKATNFSVADDMTWGQGLGCQWAVGDCGATWPKDWYFCESRPPSNAACGYDRTYTGYCNLEQYVDNLPVPYQHFPNGTSSPWSGDGHMGGKDLFADACPFVVSYSEGQGAGPCQDPANVPSPNEMAVSPGPSARCFQTRTTPIMRLLPSSATPGCYMTICDVPNDRVFLKLGPALYPCREGALFQLDYPPRWPNEKSVLVPGVRSIVSFDRVGLVQCGYNLSAMCGTTSGKGRPGTFVPAPTTVAALISAASWATITRLEPATGFILGGTQVTVTGTGLTSSCSSLRVGGAFVTNVTIVSATVMTATTTVISAQSYLGGPLDDGLGKVDVELWCNLTLVCPEGCAVDRLIDGFELVRSSGANGAAAFSFSGSWFADFLSTTIGKVVGAIVGLVVVVILVFILRQCFCSGGGGGEAANAQHKAARAQGGRGPARRARLSDSYDDELL